MTTIETYKGIEIKYGFNGVITSSEGSGLNKGRIFKNKNMSLVYNINGSEFGFSLGSNDYKDFLSIVKREIDSKI